MNVADDAGAHTRRRTLTKASVAIGLALAWLAAAAWLWRTEVPGDLDLPSLDPSAFFPAEHLSRAERWSRGSRILYFTRLAVELAVLAFFVWKGKALAGWLVRWTKGRIRTAVAMCWIVILTVWLFWRPLGAIGHWRQRDYGLTHQSYWGWFTDSARSVGIELVLYGLAVAGAVWLASRFGRRWWLVASPILVGLSVVFILVQPLVLQPLTNDYRPLTDPELKAQVERLADEMGVDIDTVVVSDASRRTTVPNASMAGIGPTRRVVLDDTILDGRFDEPELLSVTAHELAHVERRHLWKGLGWFALFAIPGLALVAWVTNRRGGLQDPGLVPLALLTALLFTLVTGPLQDAVSRRYEAEADWLALVATKDPDAMIRLQTTLSEASIGDPDPPAWAKYLWATHPTAMERIGMAEAYRARP